MKDRRYVACEGCLRQYDVTWLEPGQRLACVCGERVIVRHHTPHAPRVQRCPGCGADLPDGRRTCSFCQLVISPDERRLTSVCPACFARMAHDAGFCMECGVAIDPQVLAPLPEDAACPRCESALSSRRVDDTPLVDCATCGGLWLSPDVFDRLAEDATARRPPARLTGPVRQRLELAESVRYLPCPVCATPMTRRNYAGRSGVVLDVCTRHGVWFDRDELEHVLTYIRTGGGVDDRPRELPPLPPTPPVTTGRRGHRLDDGEARTALRDLVQRILFTDLF